MLEIAPTDFGKFTADLVKEFAGPVFARAKSLTADQINRLKAAYRMGLNEYISDTILRSNKVKTILYRDRNVPIDEIYVHTTFRNQDNMLDEDQFFAELSRTKRAIIVGSAGSGKSIFVKHAVLRSIRNEEKRAPIFVELRHINHFSTSIMHYMLEQLIKPNLPHFDQNVLDFSLKSGLFTVILDGFDEVNYDKRSQYLQEIAYMGQRYRDLEILVSTRPEDSIMALDGFDIFHVRPLTKNLAAELIGKLAYEPDVKAKFLDSLTNVVYDNHTEFASNPLLLTMLLLTYDQIGEVPRKMHIFFNQAFETLVFKHDRLKSLYQRKTYSELDIEELKKLYSIFCAVSYAENEISFTEERCNKLLKEAIDFFGLKTNVDNLKNDLIHSFSMLKRDGLFITFVHRSFQEYFCAYFLSRDDEIDFCLAVDVLSTRSRSEQCLKLLFDMSSDRVLLRWMKPVVASAADDLDAISSSMDISYFLNIFYYGIKVDRSGNLHLGEPKSLTRKLAICADLLSSEIACEAAAIFGAISGPVDRKKLEDFFGQKMPFEGELVEPRPEDNSWLQSSWLEDHISKIRTFVSAVRVHIDRVADARQAKSRLFERAPLEPHATSSLEKFYAKGKPQVIVDPMTRRERAIPRLREISRKVIHIEKPVDESGF